MARGHVKTLGHEGTRARKNYKGTYNFFEGTRFLSWGMRARKIYHVSGHEGTRFSRLTIIVYFGTTTFVSGPEVETTISLAVKVL